MAIQPMPMEVYCSYKPADDGWLRKLEKHLSVLQRQRLISLWYEGRSMARVCWAIMVEVEMELSGGL